MGNVVILKNCLHTQRIMVMHSNERGECDVGWNPNHPIFHERSGSREEHKEHEGETRGITRGNTRETLQHTRMITQALDPRTQRKIQDPKSTTDDTRGNRFFSVRRS